jgi:predicted nucleic acid-binding protein
MGVDTKSMADAWSLWHRIWDDVRVVFVPEPEDIEKKFRALSRMPRRSPKVRADAYMLAFAAVAGLKLITFDRALKSRGNDMFVL